MHFNDLRKGRDLTCSDGPDGFIGNNQAVRRCALWNGGGQLCADNIKCFARFTIAEAFPDAQDCNQTSITCSNRLGAYIVVCFAVDLAPFRVASDNIFCTRIFDHRG